MRNAIFALAFLPTITLGQSYSESHIKALEDANHVKYSGGLSSAFSSNQNQGLNWFKHKAFELDKELTIRMCGDGLCYLQNDTGSMMIAVKQENSDFNGRKLQGQFIQIVGTDMYGTMVAERLSPNKKAGAQPAKQAVMAPVPTKPEYDFAAHFDELIKARSAEGWTRPPSARKGMVVELQIGMTPDGTVESVRIAKTSGDEPFDTSAVAAVKNIGRLTEMQEMKPSDTSRYQSFKMKFTPEDLSF